MQRVSAPISPFVRHLALRILGLDSRILGCSVCVALDRNVLPSRLNKPRLGLPQERYVLISKGADMWRRHKALARLKGELNTLALFDRVHECTQDHDPSSNRAHTLRQVRRAQIIAEITQLSTSQLEHWNRTRITSVILLLCAGGYAVHYFLR